MTVNKINRQAAEWAAAGDALSEEQRAALDAWLATDKRHFGAYLNARAVFLRVERFASAPETHKVERLHPNVPRRFVLAGAIAASLVVVAVTSDSILRQFHQDTYSTGIGEMRVVTLSDGSLITLNTVSKARVHYTEATRTVTLVQGEALFDVAKNKSREFVVNARNVQIHAVGTSFAVRSTSDSPLEVLVREGIVKIDRLGMASTFLPANSRAVIADGNSTAIQSLTQTNVVHELAWRGGHIFFQRASLATAAREFSRYSRTSIVIDDPTVAKLTVTGFYVSTNPVGFAKAVAVSLDLNVEVGDNEVRLTRRSAAPAP